MIFEIIYEDEKYFIIEGARKNDADYLFEAMWDCGFRNMCLRVPEEEYGQILLSIIK